jgi:hypothetical protein
MTVTPATAVKTKIEGSGVEVADDEDAVKYSTVFKKNAELLASPSPNDPSAGPGPTALTVMLPRNGMR